MHRLQWLPMAPRAGRSWPAVAAAALLGAVAAGADEEALRVTPARVAYIEGDVSFWRPGAGDWEAATINIPLAAGDALATRDGRVELQVGPQAFLRVGEQTQVRVRSQEPDFLQVEVSQGSAVLDLRRLRAGHVVEIDTPQAAVTADRDGFYRVDVDAESTRLTVRRAGAASLTPIGGQAIEVATGEAAAVRGGPAAQFEIVAAPGFDEWDRWNYARADSFLAAPHSPAVSADVYGVAELDRYGSWRQVPTYGRVWVPYSVPAGWAPYTTGRWLWDGVYGWSWVDYAPWGWAPFHYGRWVYSGYWAWAPGPVVVRPIYAPALVAFFTPAVSISIGFGVPYVSWVALGWGEPLVPWWGGVGFVGVPCWYGWGGPRVVNNIVINTGDTVHPDHIKKYRNADAPGGLVGVPKDHFDARELQRVRLANLTSGDVKPLYGAAPLSAAAPAGRQAVPKGALPDLGSARRVPADTGAHAAAGFSRGATAATGTAGTRAAPPKPPAERAPYERLRAARSAPASSERLPGQTPLSVGVPSVNRNAAPPLRGLAKPEGGSADAYRRVGRAAAAPAGAPADLQRRASAPAPVARPAEAPPNAGVERGPAGQPAPALPKVRAMASNFERAPTADPAPAPKAPALPSLGAAPGGASPMGAAGMGGAGLRGGSPSGGSPGAGSGARPSFSR
jgi:hypothetical protein